MNRNIKARVCAIADYIIENRATVRQTAAAFGISKSTVHKDMRTRLGTYDKSRYEAVADILAFNLSERHIRGGIATKEKYKKIKSVKT